MTFKPDDFKFSMMEEALHLHHMTVATTGRAALDAKTAFWVIRIEAWREFMRSADFMNTVRITQDGKHRNELLGLPVRLTIDDEPDVPMIQLVMEPLIAAGTMRRKS